MPQEPTDTGLTAPQVPGTTVTPGGDPNTQGTLDNGDTTQKSFLATYRTKEDAEKGLREKDETITRFKQERDNALHNASSQDAILERLVEIESKRAETSVQPQETQAEQEARYAAMIQEWDEKGSEVIARDVTNLLRDSETRLTKAQTQEREKLESEITLLKQQLEGQHPDVVAYGETINELELGKKFPNLSKAKLVEIARMVRPEVQQPARPEPAGTTESTRTVEPESGSTVSADMKDTLEALYGKLTKEELDALGRKT